MHDFNDLEGLRIAIEMEKRGEALYRKAARVSRKREVVDMLSSLANDEVAHAAEFTRLYEEVLSKDRGCAPVFMAHGMHCLSCPMSVGESIEMASMVHGVDADALVKALNEYFKDK